MWRILSILSSIVLIASAWIGLLNKKKLETEIKNVETATSTLNSTNQELEKTTTQYEESEGIRKEKEALAKQKEEEKAKYIAKNEGLSSEIATVSQKHKSEADKLADARKKMENLPDLDALQDEIDRMSKQDAELAQKNADTEAQIAAAEARYKDVEVLAKTAEEREQDITNRMSSPDLKARLVEVHGSYGFVVIDAGINKRVIKDSRLAVMRGTEKVGELLVKGVERTRSSADIVPGSVKEGSALMPGDTVVAIRSVVAPKTAPKAGGAVAGEDAGQKSADAEDAGEDVFGDSDAEDDTSDDGATEEATETADEGETPAEEDAEF